VIQVAKPVTCATPSCSGSCGTMDTWRTAAASSSRVGTSTSCASPAPRVALRADTGPLPLRSSAAARPRPAAPLIARCW